MMKLYVILCFCVVLCFGKAQDQEDLDVKNNTEIRRIDGDTSSPIVRPCSLRDLNCIRRFFAQHSYCTPAYGPTPDPYTIPQLPLPVPNANITFTWNKALVKGLRDAEIKEFNINKETNRLVLEIEVPTLTIFSPASVARYHIKGREPIELSDYSFITYRMVSLTLTVPITNKIEINKAFVYAYVGTPAPLTNIGAGISNSDPDILRSFNTMMDNISISMREAFVAQGPVHMTVFLESTICNFGNY